MRDFVAVLAAQAAIISDAFAAIATAAEAEIPPPFTVLGVIGSNGELPDSVTMHAGTDMGAFAASQVLYSRASADAVDMDFDPGHMTVNSIDTSPSTVLRITPSSWNAVAGHVIVSRP